MTKRDERLKDYQNYQHASHGQLMDLTRSLISMPYGDLVKLHKKKAEELGATSPSVVFMRAVLFMRLAYKLELKS